jgi:uncharacterized protein YraI
MEAVAFIGLEDVCWVASSFGGEGVWAHENAIDTDNAHNN